VLDGAPCLAAARQEPTPAHKHTLPPLWSRLGLTREQKDRIYAIRADYRPRIEELRQQIRALEKKQMAEMVELLTPAQKARRKELVDEQREKAGRPDKKASPTAEKPAEKPPAEKKP
jgi:Spy/CpxP family protein refolding chaperone